MSALLRTITVALVGNPNTGKSTLFNALSGLRQRVGNYPGCTVEEKIGTTEHDGQPLTLVDLPGTYSLAPRSPDEMIAVEVLLGRRADTPPPDVVLCIIDASNLERNLYLLSQVREAERPVVVALNMIDVARDQGMTIDVALLEKRLGSPVVEVQANTGYGVEELKTALVKAAGTKPLPPPRIFAPAFEQEVAALQKRLPSWPRYLVERLLLDTSGYFQSAGLPGADASLTPELTAARERLAALGMPVPAVEAMARYVWVAEALAGVVERPATRPVTWSDRLDAILTHRIWGTLFFLIVMLVVFQSIFSWAAPLSDLIDGGVGAVADFVGSLLPEGMVKSLLVTGVIGGVGGVLVFLPQIVILFGFIALLEDCGYMARAAYLMDRLMAGVGLSGKSFIPLLSSFACAIPGIMATRVIDNPRDRLVTMLIAPLMSCSARLPVYTLLIAAFIPNEAVRITAFGTTLELAWALPVVGWTVGLTWPAVTMFAMYLIGIVTAILVAWVLKSTILAGDTPPFVMELPPYKTPAAGNVVFRMGERAWSFLARAGTLILAVSVLVWALSYFPRDEKAVAGPHRARIAELESTIEHYQTIAEDRRSEADQKSLAAAEEELAGIQNHIDSEYLERSLLGQMGHWIEPVVRPLGWDWRIGCAAIASFPAREVVVGTLGVIYSVGEADEESDSLRESLQAAKWPDGRPVFTIPVALSLMVFFALCAQCAATLAVMVRETNGYAWPAFTFLYMTGLAYVAALVTYQGGTWLAGG